VNNVHAVSALAPDNVSVPGPNVIGATGGSGTRVVARIVRGGGTYIGTNLNAYEDALDLAAYYDRWINRYVAARERGEEGALADEMTAELRGVLATHCAELPANARAWGWKEPRSVYLLPFLNDVLPSIRFLHVVRDGRDMAFSDNQKQLLKHGDAVLGGDLLARVVPKRRAARSIELWSRVNSAAADFGERELGDRYLRIRFEDLCLQPAETAAQIYRFFELEGDPESVAREVRDPGTLGRWKTRNPRTIDELERAGGAALARFGYA
jgi:Sulfotransferase family